MFFNIQDMFPTGNSYTFKVSGFAWKDSRGNWFPSYNIAASFPSHYLSRYDQKLGIFVAGCNGEILIPWNQLIDIETP